MKFENITAEDLSDIYKPDPPLISDSMTMEEMISVASHMLGNSPDLKNKTPISSEYDDKSMISRAPQRLSNQNSDLRSLISKGRQ